MATKVSAMVSDNQMVRTKSYVSKSWIRVSPFHIAVRIEGGESLWESASRDFAPVSDGQQSRKDHKVHAGLKISINLQASSTLMPPTSNNPRSSHLKSHHTTSCSSHPIGLSPSVHFALVRLAYVSLYDCIFTFI